MDLALLVGCGGASDPADSQLASDGNQAMIAAAQSTSLGGVVFDAVTVSDPDGASSQLLSPGKLWPWSCAARTPDDTAHEIVQLTFEKCLGPFGLHDIDGAETVTFSGGDEQTLRAVISSTTLTAEGAPVQHGATAELAIKSGMLRTVIWEGTWARTNEDGDAVSHDGDLQIDVDVLGGCRTATGSAATRVANRSVDTVINGYRICRDAATGVEGCPSGSVVHTGMPSGKTLTVVYDGTASATVTGSTGDTFGLPLLCDPL